MSILDKLKKAQAPSTTPNPTLERHKEPEPVAEKEPQYLIVYGKQALVLSDLAVQYYIQYEDGKEEYVFKSDTQVKLCKKQN